METLLDLLEGSARLLTITGVTVAAGLPALP